MVSDVCPEELAAVLDKTAEEMILGAGWTAPPIDAFSLAQALDVTVAFDACQPERGRLVRLRGVGAAARTLRPISVVGCHEGGATPLSHCESNEATLMVLRPDSRPERQQWAAAHELGEYAAWQVFDRLGVDMRLVVPAWRERVASLLASRLLLPSCWFRPVAEGAGWDLLKIKACFITASHELILRRMLDFEPPLVISVFDQGQLTLRLSNVPGRVPPPQADELACVQSVRRTARPARRGTTAAWPAYEPGWRRELVRWEVAEG